MNKPDIEGYKQSDGYYFITMDANFRARQPFTINNNTEIKIYGRYYRLEHVSKPKNGIQEGNIVEVYI